MSLTDVYAIVRELRGTTIGMRVANVYSVNAKTYLFKLQRAGEPKKMLLLESGVRLHTTRYARPQEGMPSMFAMKMRKHIKTKRIVAIRQIKSDRVIDFTLGSGEVQVHVILELYAAGNVVLTDKEYRILQVLRVHDFADDVRVRVGETYPLDGFASAVTAAAEGGEGETSAAVAVAAPAAAPPSLAALRGAELGAWLRSRRAPSGTSRKKMGKYTLRNAIASLPHFAASAASGGGFSAELLDHAICGLGLSPSTKLKPEWTGFSADDVASADAALSAAAAADAVGDAVGEEAAERVASAADLGERLATALRGLPKARKMMREVAGSSAAYIVMQKQPPLAAAAAKEGGGDAAGASALRADGESGIAKLFDDFTPLLLAQHRGRDFREFKSFDEAIDEFFSQFEIQQVRRVFHFVCLSAHFFCVFRFTSCVVSCCVLLVRLLRAPPTPPPLLRSMLLYRAALPRSLSLSRSPTASLARSRSRSLTPDASFLCLFISFVCFHFICF